MPRLWSDTIEAHRQGVHDAIVDTTITLVEEQGLFSVTMSKIAEETGIGRATLYKYFPDVESILHVWHQRQIEDHLKHLEKIRDSAHDPGERLAAVLEGYALIAHEFRGHGDAQLSALLHRDEQVVRAEHHLHEMIRALLTEASHVGNIRDDVAPGELASYCLHAMTAANHLPSKAAVRRLVQVTLAGLRPPS
jgi:AcrR family transcriptional regulator